MKRGQIDGTVQDEVLLAGSNVPNTSPVPIKKTQAYEIETLINAQSVAASNVVVMTFDTKNAMCYLMVTIDQQPWSLQPFNYPQGITVLTASNGFYPLANSSTTLPSINSPTVHLCLIPSGNMQQPTNWQEAHLLAQVGVSTHKAQIANNSTITATVTVKILRVWR